MAEPRTCNVCGCTDEAACPGGCAWVAADVCSACHLGAILDRCFHHFADQGLAAVASSFLDEVAADPAATQLLAPAGLLVGPDVAEIHGDRQPLLYGAGGEVVATTRRG